MTAEMPNNKKHHTEGRGINSRLFFLISFKVDKSKVNTNLASITKKVTQVNTVLGVVLDVVNNE